MSLSNYNNLLEFVQPTHHVSEVPSTSQFVLSNACTYADGAQKPSHNTTSTCLTTPSFIGQIPAGSYSFCDYPCASTDAILQDKFNIMAGCSEYVNELIPGGHIYMQQPGAYAQYVQQNSSHHWATDWKYIHSTPEAHENGKCTTNNAIENAFCEQSRDACTAKAKRKRVRKPTQKSTSTSVDIQFTCSVCYQSYKSAKRLDFHRQKCTPIERKYACDTCGMVFNQRCTLRVHKRRHTGEKPYQCRYCKKMFKDNSSRTKHERIHTEDKQYMCDACDYKSNQSGNLIRHKRKVHGQEVI